MALPAILTEKVFRIVTVVLCGILVFLALMIIIPLALSSNEAGGVCLLYASNTGFGPNSVCDYVHAVTALFHLFLCLPRAVLLVVVLCGKLHKEELLSNHYVLLGCALVDVLACFLTLVSGGLVSHGFSTMCSEVFYPLADRCGSLPFFAEASSKLVKHYYTRLNIVQGSVWCSWVVWLLLVAVDILIMFKAGFLTPEQFSSSSSSSSCSPCSCFSGVCPGTAATGNSTTNNASKDSAPRIRRDRETNQSQSSGVMLLFKRGGGGGGGAGGDSDTDSGPRTPPPSRPVPPRPAVDATRGAGGAAARHPGGAASARPLMEKY